MLFSVLLIFAAAAAMATNEIGGEATRWQVYIVFMGDLPEVRVNLVDEHHNLLIDVIGNEETAREAWVYSYGRSFNGFAAKLLPHEADRLSRNTDVVSIFPDTTCHLLTTRSWDFLDMPIDLPRNHSMESNMIIGLLDSGIYVPSKSFSDADFGPPPKSWKGRCEVGENFTGCNKKVIGARYFDALKISEPGQRSPADFTGHGTHTSSIAAGVPVEHASLHGIAEGTARGGVPLARIAMYKVCNGAIGCQGTDILAGFDAAIDDGVDIISVSIGGPHPDYLHNPIAIGSLYAIKKGILVVAAAGNFIRYSSVVNSAPWIMTVAASTTDRVLPDGLTAVKARSQAPMVSTMSSKGPDKISKRILKPDLAAPGVDILAAYSRLAEEDPRDFKIISGTSMAAPHVSSAAAYLKTFHPDWSPAVLRSALMTTAKPMRWNPGDELASGAGNIDPLAAMDPGLVYDIDPDLYDLYKCSLENATSFSSQSSNIHRTVKCPDIPDEMGHDGLNYPSFHYQLNTRNETDIYATFHRTLTCLGEGDSEYNVHVDSPEGLSISVEPETLRFNESVTRNSFTVTLKGRFLDKKKWYLSGWIAWFDSVHLVKSPVLVSRPHPHYFT